MQTFDFIVVGLGTAGSATCMALARRGYRVLGLDAYQPPHRRGSHHGGTRSVRRAYLEGSSYVPMAMTSWELWRKLERDTDRALLVETGNLTIGPADCPAVQGFLKSAKTYDIPHEFVTAQEIKKRWAPFTPAEDFVGGLEKEAGIVFTEPAISAFLEEAHKAGARLNFNKPVVKLVENRDGVTVMAAGTVYEAGRLLVAAGSWTAELLGLPEGVLTPQRVPVHWFNVGNNPLYSLGKYPVNFWQIPVEEDRTLAYRELYSLPTTSQKPLVKAAFHNGLARCDPNFLDRKVSQAEISVMKTVMSRYFHGLVDQHVEAEVCLYTMTSDGDFYLGKIPATYNIYGVALAGHGFKFAPVLGEMLADLLTDTELHFNIEKFSPSRFMVQPSHQHVNEPTTALSAFPDPAIQTLPQRK